MSEAVPMAMIDVVEVARRQTFELAWEDQVLEIEHKLDTNKKRTGAYKLHILRRAV